MELFRVRGPVLPQGNSRGTLHRPEEFPGGRHSARIRRIPAKARFSAGGLAKETRGHQSGPIATVHNVNRNSVLPKKIASQNHGDTQRWQVDKIQLPYPPIPSNREPCGAACMHASLEKLETARHSLRRTELCCKRVTTSSLNKELPSVSNKVGNLRLAVLSDERRRFVDGTARVTYGGGQNYLSRACFSVRRGGRGQLHIMCCSPSQQKQRSPTRVVPRSASLCVSLPVSQPKGGSG